LTDFFRGVAVELRQLSELVHSPLLLFFCIAATVLAYLFFLATSGWLRMRYGPPAKAGDPPPRVLEWPKFGINLLWTFPIWLVELVLRPIGLGIDSQTKNAGNVLAAMVFGAALYTFFVEIIPMRSTRANATCGVNAVAAQGERAVGQDARPVRLRVAMGEPVDPLMHSCSLQIWPSTSVVGALSSKSADVNLEDSLAASVIKAQSFECRVGFDRELAEALRLSGNAVVDRLSGGQTVGSIDLRVNYKRGLGDQFVVITSVPCV
jgi:hypothetical protein